MRALTTEAIRRAFLDFFKEHDHHEVPSGALIPTNDPTLLFTAAGMVPFKDVFTGKETRRYTRATSAQKCLRAGGKHNDLENVGFTPRHHTFFEMMGNFSFGDYFKEAAIQMAWKALTERLGIDPDRLCVTVFAGEPGIPADEEAEAMWRSVGVPAERIFRLGKEDNFWQMGDTGPQGPCSEIHFHMHGSTRDSLQAEKVAASDGWMEIWNLVFMQFERASSDGPLRPLPKPCIDTGAGLERLAVVLQGKQSNYEIDIFEHLLASIADAAKKKYSHSEEPDNVSMRVIADHARATAFLVADGLQPSNDGRGYVLRRIMRRAIRHGERLGFDELFFHNACLSVIDTMGTAYPELEKAKALITKVAQSEETSFRQTLSRGLRRLEQQFQVSSEEGSTSLEPEFVATLYDTYGFPIDLTRVIAEERGMNVDEDTAHAIVRDKQSQGNSAELLSGTKSIDQSWFDLREQHGATTFVGYTTASAEVTIKALIHDGQQVSQLNAGQSGVALLEPTPFYGESGGQVGDSGQLLGEDGTIYVNNTTKPLPEIHAHHLSELSKPLAVGQKLKAVVDTDRLANIKRNHSATHLLHLALRETLGDHVQQKGSLVDGERLRFDYAHFEALSPNQQREIEARINQIITDNAPTEITLSSIQEAQKGGAMMLFGEKYADEVRVVRIGGDSLELCGGIHVQQAGEIGFFTILSDSALASGVRRIEALTGPGALRWVQQQTELLQKTSAILRVPPSTLPDRVDKLSKRVRQLEKSLEEVRAQAAMGNVTQAQSAEEIGGIKVIFKNVKDTPRKALRPLADKLRDTIGSGVVVLTAPEGDKVALLVAATKDLSGRVHAGQLVQAATKVMDGSGGGRPDFAQGGGHSEHLEKGLTVIRSALAG